MTRQALAYDARLARTAEALVAAGARVSVVAATTDPGVDAAATEGGRFEVHLFPRPAPKPLRRSGSGVARPSLFEALGRYLRSTACLIRMSAQAWALRADIYHSCDLTPLPAAWLVSALRRKPLIYEAREISTDREAYQRFSTAVARVEGFFARRSDGFITTTGMRAQHFREAYGLTDVAVVQNRPVYTTRRSGNRIRQRAGLDDSEIVCLYQGGLQQGRGLPELLQASVRVPKAHVVFLGRGALADDLTAMARDLGIADRVHVLPAVRFEELPEWTASADVGIQLLQNTCLNHYTTDSNKLFEYAMAGLPVLASDFPEIRKILEEWGFGLLVDPADEAAVVAALTRLTEDPELRARLSEAALNAAPHLDWSSQVPALLSAYVTALRRSAITVSPG